MNTDNITLSLFEKPVIAVSSAPNESLQVFTSRLIMAFRAYASGPISIFGTVSSLISLLIFSIKKGWPGNCRIYFILMNLFAFYFYVLYFMNNFLADGLKYFELYYFDVERLNVFNKDFMCKLVNFSACMTLFIH